MTELGILIENECNTLSARRRDRDVFKLFGGQVYSDNHFISLFPLKYKVNERLAQLKELIFFLASTYNIDKVKKNRGIFFTKDTFEKAGIHISHQMQSIWIEGMKRCGLIYVLNNRYKFNHGAENFSKLYGFDVYGVIKSFPTEYKEYIDKHKIETPPDSVVEISENITAEVFENKKDSKIKDNITHFTKNTLKEFERMLQEYNEDKTEYNKKRFKFKCKGNKITGRAYSNYIATEKDDFYETDRTLWCKKNNLKYRYDIKSAVPRISHLMHTGEWKDADFDFYEEMSRRSGIGLSRNHMKEVHMRLRFSQSAEKSFSEFLYANSKIVKKRYYNCGNYDYFCQDVRPRLLNDWRKLYSIVEDLEGTDHSSAVFYFESFIELYVVWKLKQMGVTAYNIYDEFFYDKECDITSIIKEAANYLYEKIGEYNGVFRRASI